MAGREIFFLANDGGWLVFIPATGVGACALGVAMFPRRQPGAYGTGSQCPLDAILEAAILWRPIEPCNQEDRAGAGARSRVGPSAESLSRVEQAPLGYGVRGCWPVPAAASGRFVRSHLALHIELHLGSGDVLRRAARDWWTGHGCFDFGIHGEMWGIGERFLAIWGTIPPSCTSLDVLFGRAWGLETGPCPRQPPLAGFVGGRWAVDQRVAIRRMGRQLLLVG